MAQNTRKVTQPILWQNSRWPKFLGKGSKMAQNGLFQHFLKMESLFLAGNRLKCWTLGIGCIVHHTYVWGNSRLAKFWVKRPESSRPIRLLNFQNAITSKPFDRLTVYLKFLYEAFKYHEGNKQKILWW